MAISKAATISVFAAAVLLFFTPIHPGIIFGIAGIGVTFLYRAIKGCFNFINPMALTGSGAVILTYFLFPNIYMAIGVGMIISVIVGLLIP